MKINAYESCKWYTVINDNGKIRITTKENIDAMDRTIILPKKLIMFILINDLPSPLTFSLLTPKEEVWWLIDAICYSPDMKEWFLTLKNLVYLTR